MKEKNIQSKCGVWENDVFVDQYYKGECKNCGWKFSKDEELLEKKAGVSYPMLVTLTTAREKYKKGLPFKATYNEFVNGLYFIVTGWMVGSKGEITNNTPFAD